jgi:outer membrane protein assembly factor BamB
VARTVQRFVSTLVITGLAGLAAAAFAPTAVAASGTPTVTAPAVVNPGGRVTVSGSGFNSGKTVELTIGITPAGTAVVSGDGRFTTVVTVPNTLVPGGQPLAATERSTRLTATTAVTARSDWPQAGGDAAHTGVNPAETLVTPATAGSTVPKWSVAVDIGYSSPPVVSGGLVVQAGATAVVARRTSDGTQVWRVATPEGSSSVAVAGSLVLVTSYADGTLRALDLATGKLVWDRDWSTGTTSTRVGDLVVDGGRAFAVLTTTVGSAAPGTSVVALSATSGATAWTTSLTSGAELAVAGGRVYLTTASGKLAALSAATGAFVWVRPTGGLQLTQPVVAGGLVLTGTGAYYGQGSPLGPVGVRAFDAATGALRWTWNSVYTIGRTNRPAVADGLVHIGITGGEFEDYLGAEFIALNLQTGAVQWIRGDIPETGGSPPTSPVVAGGVVWSGSCGPNAKFLGFNASTGATVRDLWYVRCGTAVAVNARVLISEQGKLQALGLPTERAPVRSVDDDETGTGTEKLGYTGPWVTGAGSGAYGGGQHATTDLGSKVTLPFTGTGVRYWFSTQPDGGSAEIYIDGTSVGTVDQYGSARVYARTSWTSPVVKRGDHTLSIVVRGRTTPASTGNRTTVDRIDVAH